MFRLSRPPSSLYQGVPEADFVAGGYALWPGAFPAGGDRPKVNPDSPAYPLDVSAALSEDRKTLAVAVLNPSDSQQNITIAINGAKLARAGKLWRMATDSIDATVQVDKKPEVQVEEQTHGALPGTITIGAAHSLQELTVYSNIGCGRATPLIDLGDRSGCKTRSQL